VGLIAIPTLGRGVLAVSLSQPPVFRSESDSGDGDSLGICPAPAGILNGDCLVAIACYLNDNPTGTPGTVTCTPPAGFTSRSKQTYSFTGGGAVANQQLNLEVFTKFALSESGSYTFALSTNDAGASAYSNVIMLAYSGVNVAQPVGVVAASTYAPSSSSGSASVSATVGRNGSLLLWIFAGLSTDASLPAGFTARATDVDGVHGVAELQTRYGPTGTVSGTVAGDAQTQNGGIAMLLALQPKG